MSTIKVAVAGCGYMGAEQARALAAIPEVELVGVWNRTPDRARRLAVDLDVKMFTGLDEMLDQPGLAGLIVATANHVHLEPVLAAAQRGIHIFLEKPMALSVADCDKMICAAQNAGVILLPGHSMRFSYGCQMMKELIDTGRIGRPLVARSLRNTWTDLVGADSWKLRRQEAGSDLFHHIHEVDLLYWLLGDAHSVFTRMGNLAHPHLPEYDDAIFVSLEFCNGALAHMEFGSVFRHAESEVMIGGTQGALILDHHKSELALNIAGDIVETWPYYRDEASQASLLEFAATAGRQAGNKVYGVAGSRPPLFLQKVVEQEMHHFVQCILGKETPLVEPLEARQAVALAEAALTSAIEGRPVSLAC